MRAIGIAKALLHSRATSGKERSPLAAADSPRSLPLARAHLRGRTQVPGPDAQRQRQRHQCIRPWRLGVLVSTGASSLSHRRIASPTVAVASRMSRRHGFRVPCGHRQAPLRDDLHDSGRSARSRGPCRAVVSLRDATAASAARRRRFAAPLITRLGEPWRFGCPSARGSRAVEGGPSVARTTKRRAVLG